MKKEEHKQFVEYHEWRLGHRTLNKAILFLGMAFLIIFLLSFIHKRGYFNLPGLLLPILRTCLIIIGAYFIAAMIIRITTNRVVGFVEEEAEIEHLILVRKVYAGIWYIFATLIVLWQLGVTAENITIFLGLAATGIAFAIRDILMSYFAWLVMLTKRPFRIGDYIKIGDDEGRVQHIGTFYVVIDESPERYEDYVRIPNRLFLEKPIRNYGRTEIQYSTLIPLKELPHGIEKKLQKLTAALKKETKKDVIPRLETDKERWYVKIDHTTTHALRKAQTQAILQITIKELGLDEGEKDSSRK